MTNIDFERLLKYVPLALAIVFIWVHSMIPGEESSGESSFVWEIIAPILEIIIGKGRATLFFVRKLAHFAEFFVLGGISTLTFKDNNRFTKSIVLGIIVASIDETIQLFVPGRAGMIKDVLLDISGVIFAVLCVFITLYVLKHIREHFLFR